MHMWYVTIMSRQHMLGDVLVQFSISVMPPVV